MAGFLASLDKPVPAVAATPLPDRAPLQWGTDHVCRILGKTGVIGIDTETTIARAHDRILCTVQVTHEDGERAMCQVFGKPREVNADLGRGPSFPCHPGRP